MRVTVSPDFQLMAFGQNGRAGAHAIKLVVEEQHYGLAHVMYQNTVGNLAQGMTKRE